MSVSIIRRARVARQSVSSPAAGWRYSVLRAVQSPTRATSYLGLEREFLAAGMPLGIAAFRAGDPLEARALESGLYVWYEWANVYAKLRVFPTLRRRAPKSK